MICPAMQEAFDLYIFFVKPGANQQYDAEDDDNIGCLGVQVKDWKEVSGIRSTHMESYKCKASADEFVSHVKMLLHVGVIMEGKETVQSDSFVVQGCHMVSIDEDICETIRFLLCESSNPISIMCREIQDGFVDSDEQKLELSLHRETSALKSILSAIYPEVQAEDALYPGVEVNAGVEVTAEVTAYPEVKAEAGVYPEGKAPKVGNKRTHSSTLGPG